MCLVWREIGVQGIEVIQAKNTLVSVRLLVLVYTRGGYVYIVIPEARNIIQHHH